MKQTLCVTGDFDPTTAKARGLLDAYHAFGINLNGTIAVSETGPKVIISISAHRDFSSFGDTILERDLAALLERTAGMCTPNGFSSLIRPHR